MTGAVAPGTLLAAVLLAGAGLAGPAFAKEEGRAQCGSCHAIGRAGDSPLAIAPPFRILHTRYPVEDLAEALAEGITTGHPTMPQFQLDPAQINDLIAYLRTLER